MLVFVTFVATCGVTKVPVRGHVRGRNDVWTSGKPRSPDFEKGRKYSAKTNVSFFFSASFSGCYTLNL